MLTVSSQPIRFSRSTPVAGTLLESNETASLPWPSLPTKSSLSWPPTMPKHALAQPNCSRKPVLLVSRPASQALSPFLGYRAGFWALTDGRPIRVSGLAFDGADAVRGCRPLHGMVGLYRECRNSLRDFIHISRSHTQ